MFICRHFLLRTNIPRRVPIPLLSRRPFSYSQSNDTTRQTAAGATLYLQPPNTERPAQRGVSVSPDIAKNEALSDDPMSSTTRSTGPATSPDTRTIPATNSSGAQSSSFKRLAAYIANREQGFALLLDYPIENFYTVVKAAERCRRADVVDLLVEDVLEAGHLLAPCTHYQVIEAILQCVRPKHLPKRHLLSLLRALDACNQLSWLPDFARCQIVERYLALPAQPDLDSPLFDLFSALLLELVVERSQRPAVAQGHPFGLDVWLLFRITYELTRHRRQRRALEVMQTLVDTGMLSAQAMQETDLTSGDFALIAVSATVRSCLHFGWHDRAVSLMYHVLLSELEKNPISEPFAQLALYVLGASLEYIRPDDFVDVVSVVILLVRRGPAGCIPATLLQEMYAAAQHLKQGPLAETLYGEIRHPAAVERYEYDPPRDAPLLWLMKYLSLQSKNVHLARELATQVAHNRTPILLQDRGEFIALAAEQGFARPARILWECYAAGKHRDVVVGHARAMVRLVSVFAGMIRRQEDSIGHDDPAGLAAVGSLFDGSDSQDPGASPYGPPPNVPSEAADATAEATVPARTTSPLQTLHAAAAPTQAPVHSRDGSVPQGPGDREDLGSSQASQDTTRDDAPPADFRAFAERVLAAFEASRTLQHATHYELNALARGCFLLGKVPAGFAVFQTMLARRLVPDVRDVNVALAALAAHRPAAAARALERMAALGLQPSEVTFGTLIHHALAHGETQLAAALVARARALGIVRLSYKTVGALIRAVLAGPDDAEGLARVEGLVGALLRRGERPAPNVGRDCVLAALRAENPGVAFRFWRELVKDKVEWQDSVQGLLRRRIADAIARHLEAGALEESRARVMLAELGVGRMRAVAPAE